MTRLLITRGLPASGKTTFARKLQPRVVRVNRDDLRRMLHGERLYTQWAEGQVTHAQRAAVEALLRAHADVIVDDTNLRNKTVRDWAELAARLGAQFEVHDFTDVPLEECIRRDGSRPESDRVGEEAIRRMHARYLAGRNLPLPIPYISEISVNVYEPDPALPAAVLVDIDGTVALMGDRSPYDWHRVGNDLPNPAVITAVRAMHAAGNAIIFCSGRDAVCRPETEAWLDLYVGVLYEALFMRPEGDGRKDAVVKREIFDREIRDNWRIAGVFDDRQQVVRMWRALGLTVFQVAEGDF
jgi:predicted kinase